MTPHELKAELDHTFQQFKAENQELISAVNKVRHTEESLSNELAEVRDRMNEIEANMSRAALGPCDTSAGSATVAVANQWGDILNQPVTTDQVREWSNAFDAYLRRGRAAGVDAMNSLSVSEDPAGGYWVTPDRTGRMIQKLFQTSPMRQLANVVSVGTDALEGVIDNDQAEAAWVSEKGSRPDTDNPQIGKYRIELFEQYAMPKATQQLLDDAGFNVAAWLESKIADRITRVENTAFVLGNGTGKPKGLLDYPTSDDGDDDREWGVVQHLVTGASGDFANTKPADVLIDLVYTLKAGYRSGASWLMNSATAGVIRKMKDGEDRYIWQDSLQAGQPPLLLGYPVHFAEDMPDIEADSLSVAFGDFREAYTIVDHRAGFRILRDPYTAKGYVKFYATKRTGGALVNSEAVKLLKFSA